MDKGTLTDSLTETLALFDGSGEPRTTTELAEELDLGRRSTYDRLERLVEDGRLRTKKVGANARVWWRPRTNAEEDEANGDGDGHEEFESLVEAVDEYAIFTLDVDGNVRTWNPGARRIKGYEREEIVGEHFSTFYTEGDRDDDVPERNLTAAARAGSIEDEGWRLRADGTTFWANVTITAIRDDDGDLEGFAKVTRDMTERREYERRLREERDFTRRILETAPASIFVLDADGDVVNANDRFEDQLGHDDVEGELSVGDLDVYDEAGAFVPPEERPYRTVFEHGQAVANWRCEVERPDGEHRWVTLNVEPIEGDEGAIERVVVAARDVTELQRQERRLEAQRDELRSELDDVFARIDDAFFALDADWRFVHVNDRAEAVLDRHGEKLIGRNIWEEFPATLGTSFEEEYRRAMDAQETVSFEEYYPPLSTWFQVNAYPSEEGLSVYFQDVTERVERERELERYETVVETMTDGVYVVDEEGRFTMVNDAYVSMVDRTREELLGSHVETVIDDEAVLREAREVQAELLDGESSTATVEAELGESGDDAVVGEATFAMLGEAEDYERVGVVRDVTERKRRERELERFETVIETLWDGVYALDPDENFAMVNDAFLEMTGYDRAELIGEPGRVVHGEGVNETARREVDDVLHGDQEGAVLEFDLRTKSGETVTVEARFGPYRYDVDSYGRCGVIRDVSARKEYERYLEEAKSQLEAATEAGAVGTFEWHVQEDSMVTGPSFARTFGVDPDLAREGISLDRFVERIHDEDRDDVERAIREALDACESYEEEYRVDNADGEHRWVVARGEVDCDEDGTPITFPGAVTDITERKEAELELERQRRRLAALNHLNEVVREVTDAVIEQSTREEIERTACERLAAADSYAFAWIGEADPATGTVELRTEAGVEGYLDGMTVSIESDDERSEGATGRALRTGEIQVTNDVDADDRYDPWRDHVDDHDFRSSAAIPIVHEETIYGALNVYADRPAAFTGEERVVIEQLGEIVGHAIAAVERKRALMSDEVVELVFRVEDVFDELGIDADDGGPIRLEHTVEAGDDEFVLYGSTTADCVETVETMVAEVPFYEEVTFREGTDEVPFELRVSEPPILSTVASLGGSVEDAVIENGDYTLAIHMSPSSDVRGVIDAMMETHPTARLLKRRQLTNEATEEATQRRAFMADLTDRQRTAIEAAYHAGFFEWPRSASGEEVADSLGVASPTFHQHLRKAEGKVFDAILAPESDDE